jgi:hypothetical protein
VQEYLTGRVLRATEKKYTPKLIPDSFFRLDNTIPWPITQS